MNTGLISTRYAKALLEYSIESREQQEVYERMQTLAAMFTQQPSLRRALTGTMNTKKQKISLLQTACGGGELPLSLERMIRLIFENEREELIHYIALRYAELYRERFAIQYGRLITALPIDEKTEKRFIERISKIVGGRLEVEPVVDPSIIGGFILYLDDDRWDASVAGELSRIRNRLRILMRLIETR